MTELLSREEYAAIAATLDLPQRAFIGGGGRSLAAGAAMAKVGRAAAMNR
ncbi:hypothetical protein LZK57_27085, partial [Pseudomonas aeruginosa]|nr:hypothetical protein [Pseudomonas aeruginosa]